MARVSDARPASEVSNSVEQLHPRLCWGWPWYDLGPNQRSSFVDGQGETCQRRPRTEYGTAAAGAGADRHGLRSQPEAWHANLALPTFSCCYNIYDPISAMQ
jgi:hypothetical protein